MLFRCYSERTFGNGPPIKSRLTQQGGPAASGASGFSARCRQSHSTLYASSAPFANPAVFDSSLLVDSDRHLHGIPPTHPTTYTRAEYSIHDVFVDIYGSRYTPDTAPDEPYADEIHQSHTSHPCDIALESRSSRSLRTSVDPSPLVPHPSAIRSHSLVSC